MVTISSDQSRSELTGWTNSPIRNGSPQQSQGFAGLGTRFMGARSPGSSGAATFSGADAVLRWAPDELQCPALEEDFARSRQGGLSWRGTHMRCASNEVYSSERQRALFMMCTYV